MKDRAPSSIWALRRGGEDCVVTLEDDRICLYVDRQRMKLDRRKARLLAKRINQCLDSTVKR